MHVFQDSVLPPPRPRVYVILKINCSRHVYDGHHRNAYICSKTLMEHLVVERYAAELKRREPSAVLTLVRPSIISTSVDGGGSPGTPPCVMARVVDSAVCRATPGMHT